MFHLPNRVRNYLPPDNDTQTPNTRSLGAKLWRVNGPRQTRWSPARRLPHIQRDRILPWAEVSTGQTSRSPLVCAAPSPVCQSTPSWPPESRSSPHTGGHISLSEAAAAGMRDDAHPHACTHTPAGHTCEQVHRLWPQRDRLIWWFQRAQSIHCSLNAF